MVYSTPLIAVGLTILAGMAMFAMLGKDPVQAMRLIFVDLRQSIFPRRAVGQRHTIGTDRVRPGLRFSSQRLNIGAEGQFTVGASAVALWRLRSTRWKGSG